MLVAVNGFVKKSVCELSSDIPYHMGEMSQAMITTKFRILRLTFHKNPVSEYIIASHNTWMKGYMLTSEFRLSRLTFHKGNLKILNHADNHSISDFFFSFL